MTIGMVAKLGGSLFTLPDLAERYQRWRAGVTGPVLIVPGGGRIADAIRGYDRLTPLGDEVAHWLAVRAMGLQAHVLAARLGLPVICAVDDASGDDAILDPLAFLQADELNADRLPAGWHVTSDSLAARVAEWWGVPLVLLKSAAAPSGDVRDWAMNGYVDGQFPVIVERARLGVSAVDLRTPPR